MQLLIKILLVVAIISISQAQILFPSDDDVEGQRQTCRTPFDEPGICTSLEDCQYLYNVIINPGKTRQDDEFLRASAVRCGYKGGRVILCCSQNPNPLIPNRGHVQTTTAIPTHPTTNTVESRISLLPRPGVCGTGSTERIFGGNITRIDEYPWMALLEYTKSGNRKGHHCGGSLINDRYVLTAAHCIRGKSLPADWRLTGVRLGEWDRSTEEDCVVDTSGYKDCSDPPINVPVEKVIIHENYERNMKAQYNDIALIRLSRPIQYTSWIRPVCLPFNSRQSTFDNIVLDVAGWGQTENSSNSQIKLKANVNTWAINNCNSIYSKQNVVLRDGQICAGGVKGIDSCRGDSGGPLIGQDSSDKLRVHYFIAGVVSFGPTPCGLDGWPGVYTRVGKYIDWIEANIEP